jgi:hypothetical protein
MQHLLFVEPWLCIPAAISKDQRWVIKFKAWHKQKRKLELVRDTSPNTVKNLRDRKIYCQQRMLEIKEALHEGFIIDEEAAEKAKLEKERSKLALDITIEKAIDLALEEKKTMRKSGYNTLRVRVNVFKAWLKKNKYLDYHPREIDTDLAKKFFKDLANDRVLSNRSYNNYIADISSIFSHFVKEHPEFLKQNPLEKMQRKKKTKGMKNFAFQPYQQKELFEYMEKHQPECLFLSILQYSTLFRTNEISWLKVENIGQKTPDSIYLPAEYSKNTHERNVRITPLLERMLQKLKIRDYPKHYFLFSTGLNPGIKRYTKPIGQLFRKLVLKELHYSNNYTFYSWKHTGVVAAKLAGISDSDIIMQGGWTDPHSFYTYLKSIGMYGNEGVKNWPTPPGVKD